MRLATLLCLCAGIFVASEAEQYVNKYIVSPITHALRVK